MLEEMDEWEAVETMEMIVPSISPFPRTLWLLV